jgi:predicted transposase YdaD
MPLISPKERSNRGLSPIIKYADFIDIYTALDDNELKRYQQDYAEENKAMTALSVRFTEKGIQQGIKQGMQLGRQEGRQQGEAELLLRQISRKFGPQVAQQNEARIRQADLSSLEHWADAILSAESPDELFG